MLLNKLSDKELRNYSMCSKKIYNFVMENYNDVKLWKSRAVSKFPYVPIEVHLKSKGKQSWRNYYIQSLSKFNKHLFFLNRELVKASANGDLVSVIISVRKGANIYGDHNYNRAILTALENGHSDVADFLLSNK